MNIVDTVKVLDGGFSSQLSRHLNMEAESTSHPLWCARFLFTDPGSVVDTHRDYIRGLLLWIFQMITFYLRRCICERQSISFFVYLRTHVLSPYHC